MRHASIAASKQSDGDDAATTGTGDSELRPNMKSGRPDSFDAAIKPYASAWLPVMLRYVPGVSFAGFTSYVTANDSVVSPKAYPAWSALTFAAAISGRFANFAFRKS